MVQLGSPIPFRVKNTIIDAPELFGVWIDIDTSDNANALDNLFGIATPLATNQFNGKGMALIENRIIEKDAAIF